MTRACRRSPASAGAACRRKRSANSSRASAWQAPAGSTSDARVAIRELLNKTAPRRMAVLRPLKVVIENYPEGPSEELEAVNNPDDPSAGTRKIRSAARSYVERDDFMENPPKKFFRLSPGNEVRLRYAYFITCREVGEGCGRRGRRAPLHLRSGDPRRQRARRPQGEGDAALGVGGRSRSRRKCGSTTSSSRAQSPDAANFAADLNPNSLEMLTGCAVEAALAGAKREPIQFERQGYFTATGVDRGEARLQSHHGPARYVCQGSRG